MHRGLPSSSLRTADSISRRRAGSALGSRALPGGILEREMFGQMARAAPTGRAVAATIAVGLLAPIVGACQVAHVPEGGGGATPIPGAQAPRITGWLQTKGTTLVNEGRTVRILGLGVEGMAHGHLGVGALFGPREAWQVPDATAYRDIPAWGFNSVRLQLSWANLEPNPPERGTNGLIQHHYDLRYADALDQIVRGFTSRGVAVILEMAQHVWSAAGTFGPLGKRGYGMPTWLPGSSEGTAGAIRAFFDDVDGGPGTYARELRWLAGRYAANRLVIGADMMNEPP